MTDAESIALVAEEAEGPGTVPGRGPNQGQEGPLQSQGCGVGLTQWR